MSNVSKVISFADNRTAGGLREAFFKVRHETDRLLSSLNPEDQCIQSMPDASPAKWHGAHTSWFFEEFVLSHWVHNYRPYDKAFRYLFNSYYEGVGPRLAREKRGMITRPSSDEIRLYRAHVTGAVAQFLTQCPRELWVEVEPVLLVGLNHEQQHQELIQTDILHASSLNPMRPAVLPSWSDPILQQDSSGSDLIPGGLYEIGASDTSFAFDNERPVHKVYLEAFRLAPTLVTVGEWLAFMADGGYERPGLWLSDGWAAVCAYAWCAPEYWERTPNGWTMMTLAGPKAVEPSLPICHVSSYEADAFARWAGKRLPTEAEWEIAIGSARPKDAFGSRWQWTSSAYGPYPRFRPLSGVLGEYNGKFMNNQMVLRGSSCVTPQGHSRITYRNFFYPHQRWQFTGVRLAADA